MIEADLKWLLAWCRSNHADKRAIGSDCPRWRKRKVTTLMPSTRRELITFGYQFKGSGYCGECLTHIEWWRTPNGNKALYIAWMAMRKHLPFSLRHLNTCGCVPEVRTSHMLLVAAGALILSGLSGLALMRGDCTVLLV